MIKMGNDNTIYIRRSKVFTILVRLEISDIPIAHSKKCRVNLIEYLSKALIEQYDITGDYVIEINLNDMGLYGEYLKSAINILSNYAETLTRFQIYKSMYDEIGEKSGI